MKKNVYELGKKETANYMEEFNKTDFALNILTKKKNALMVIIITLIILFALSGINVISEKEIIDLNSSFLANFSNILLVVSVIIYIFCICVHKVVFYRWLKIKHDIDY